jgi:hypothetical protein
MKDVKHFTLVFEGELSVLPANPHKTETPFGFPVACGVGDAFAKLDALEGSHDQLIEALEKAQKTLAMLTEPDAIKSTRVHEAWAQAVEAELACRNALSQARKDTP